ncbi:MAG TPA: hypothetical protein VL463_11125 [Kofleriaceae bacterium]|nr:hypothetical protein [Kofleriaceae bacterium]
MRALLIVILCAGCAKDEIDVHTPGTDYNRKGLLAAIDRYNAAGRTPEAYGKLAAELESLRSGMDETVADEAELQLIVLAQSPVEQMRGLPPSTRAQKLATTVWSVAMSGPVTAPDPALGPGDPGTPAHAGETPDAYVQRLCGGALAIECMFVIPEAQPLFVESVATRRLARRTKHAVEECEPCSSDPGWSTAVSKWEALEIETHAQASAALQNVTPDRWPVAGHAATDWTPAPSLDIADDGEWQLDGAAVMPDARGTNLAKARASSEILNVQVAPGVRADVLAALIDAAGAAGFREVHVESRLAVYPWMLRVYRFATGSRGKKPPWRAVDTVQVLLRQIDTRNEPGGLVHL